MTKFIDCSEEPKEVKETVFTHYLDEKHGWRETDDSPKAYEKVIYLGKCRQDGDMFSAYSHGSIVIFKGIKGDEFNG